MRKAILAELVVIALSSFDSARVNAQTLQPPFPQGTSYNKGMVVSDTGLGITGCSHTQVPAADGNGCITPVVGGIMSINSLTNPDIIIESLDATVTVSQTDSNHINLSVAGGGGVANYFVDSNQGNDSNDGLTALTAFRTVAKLMSQDSIIPAQTWNFVSATPGDETQRIWREQVTIPRNFMTMAAYDASNTSNIKTLPLLDASDEINASSWSLVSGTTNCYQSSINIAGYNAGISNVEVELFENGNVLQRVTSTDSCNTTAASMYIINDHAATTTIYVHPSDNSNPSTNGKTYEHSSRLYGIKGPSNITILGLWTRRNYMNDGSMVLGNNAYVKNSLVSDGTKHNILVGDGSTVESTTAHNAYFYGAGSGGSAMFVAYAIPVSGNVYFVRDHAILDSNIPAEPGVGKVSAFYSHTGTIPWTYILYDHCTTTGTSGENFDADAIRMDVIGAISDNGVIGSGVKNLIYMEGNVLSVTGTPSVSVGSPDLILLNNTFNLSAANSAILSGGTINADIENNVFNVPATGVNSVVFYNALVGPMTTLNMWNNVYRASYVLHLNAIPTTIKMDYNSVFDSALYSIASVDRDFSYVQNSMNQETNSLYYYFNTVATPKYTTAPWSSGAIAANSCVETQVAASPGLAVVGNPTIITSNSPMWSGLIPYAYASPNGYYYWKVCNITNSPIDPSSAVFTIYQPQTGKP